MQGNDRLRAELAKANAECERLRKENAKLTRRLGDNAGRRGAPPIVSPNMPAPADETSEPPNAVTNSSHPDLKVSFFRSLFRGREDVYAIRWEGKSGRTGYSPAGVREWEQSAFTKPGKKKPFRLSKAFPFSDDVVRDHLLGKRTIGVYPLLQDDTCWFVAVDFDKKSWQADACAFLKTCHETGVPASLERSRSGKRPVGVMQ